MSAFWHGDPKGSHNSTLAYTPCPVDLHTAQRSEASFLLNKVILAEFSEPQSWQGYRRSSLFILLKPGLNVFLCVCTLLNTSQGCSFWHLYDGKSEGWNYWVIWVSMACAAHSGAAWRIFSKRLLTWKQRDWICLSHVGRGSRAGRQW